MPQVSEQTLWNEIGDGTVYPLNEKWHAHLLDQYKLYVEMADRISQRRSTANNYFVTLNSAILAFVSYMNSKTPADDLWLIAVAGMVLSGLWRQGIASYRNLSTAKWLVVHEIEKRLPVRPYEAEWAYVERGHNARLYRPISHVEGGVPWIFFVLHLYVFVTALPWHGLHP